MGKTVFPDGTTLYVKNGSTEFPVISSTGGLYHQSTILPNSSLLAPLKLVTWPSTVAQTLVNTSDTQGLINKTINNVTITDPTSDTPSVLTIAGSGTLATVGAYSVTLDTTANSHVYMPPSTAEAARLLWTTDVEGKITVKSSQIGPLATVTWPSTVAQTLVNTSNTQELINKTINNVTITNPTSGTPSVLTIAGSGTLATVGAFSVTLDTTANSHVYMPPSTVEAARLLWTTDVEGKITVKSSQIGPLATVTWPSTAAQTLANTTDAQTLTNKTLGAGVVKALEVGTTTANLTNVGISAIAWSTTPNGYTLAAPLVGGEKTIVLRSTAVQDSTAVFKSVYTGSSDIPIWDNSTLFAPKLYIGLQAPLSVVRLIGVSTAAWVVQSVYGGTLFSTQAVFSS